MRTLSIDIETYSDVDLSKCGVYKYASSPAFEVLLFGYAVDGGDVCVVDLACGEQIPEEVISALSVKTSHIFNFCAFFIITFINFSKSSSNSALSLIFSVLLIGICL